MNTIKLESGESLTTVEKLLELLQTHESVTISYTSSAEQYVSNLTYSLPSHSVYNRAWDKTIFISPSIANEKILQKKFELFECAKSFREDGNRLMHLMSVTFGIDLQTLDGLHELKYKKVISSEGS